MATSGQGSRRWMSKQPREAVPNPCGRSQSAPPAATRDSCHSARSLQFSDTARNGKARRPALWAVVSACRDAAHTAPSRVIWAPLYLADTADRPLTCR